MRLIDADKLKYDAEICKESNEAFIELINRQPSAEKEPIDVIVDYLGMDKSFSCPICKGKWISQTKNNEPMTNFCPICGQAFKNGSR